MRFGAVHRVMTSALAVLGILAVLSSAAMPPVLSIFTLTLLLLAILVPESWQQKAWLRHFATLGPLGLLVLEGARLASGRSALDIAVEFAALLQVVRLATRRGAAHDQQIILLALLHFVVGTVLGGGLTFGICFFGFLVVAPGALVLSHLRREVEGNYRQGARDRTGLPVDVPRILRSRRVVGRGFLFATSLLSVPIFLFTAVLFLLFPRVGLSLLLINHGRPGRMVGFSDHVDLGEVGVLRSDPTIALRFEVPDQVEPAPPRKTLRFRGTAFDYYDGRAWQRTQTERRAVDTMGGLYPLFRDATETKERLVIDLEPIDPPVIFLPERAVGFMLRRSSQAVLTDTIAVTRGPEGEHRYTTGEARGLRYETYLAPSDAIVVNQPLPDIERARYLQQPKGVSPEVARLAHLWTAGLVTPRQKAEAIRKHLQSDFTYDINSPSSGQPNPVDHFLTHSHRGHCEFFSTTLALMLRAEQIPSRNVTGFVGGTYNRFGKYYAIREGDAHSWVEAYISDSVLPPSPSTPISGHWETLDATPALGTESLSETGGAFAYVRDLIEAVSQRWNRHVVGYDLYQQMHLFDRMSAGYDRARADAGLTSGLAERLTRPRVLLLGSVVVALFAVRIWRKRKRDGTESAPTGSKSASELQKAAVQALYRELEEALSSKGLSRSPAQTPLKYAEALEREGHPLAEKVVDLTQAYMHVRFGGHELGAEGRRAFETAIRQIRAYKAPPRSTAAQAP
ncbi:MAG: DUF3488 and transglutaminase-like domain-containing protein [Polyangiaceae bacterium]